MGINQSGSERKAAENVSTVGESADRAEIQALVIGNLNASDNGDITAKGQFFTADAKMVHHEGQFATADAKIVDDDGPHGAVQGLAALAAVTELLQKHFVTTHTFANQRIELSGDRALANTSLVGQSAVRATGQILVRGIRYLDQLVRTQEGWRIHEREHIVLWQYEVTGQAPSPLSDYIPVSSSD